MKAALIAALATSIVSVGTALADAYPDAPWLPVVSALIPVAVAYLKSGPESAQPTLAEVRLARLLDPDDTLDDLSDAEVRAVEQRGRDHQMDVKAGIHQARMVYVARQRGGEPSGG